MKKAIALTLTLAMAVTMAGCGNNQKGTVTSASGKKISTDLIKGSIKLADYKGLEVYEDEIKVEDTEVQSQIDNLLKEKQDSNVVTKGKVVESDTVNIDYTGTIKLNGEDFKFDGGSATNYDLDIDNSQFIDGFAEGLVGPTGAGKTTMVKLLMRFYDVNRGSICVDGHDVKDFNRSELHEMFGMVLQDTWLFSGTIMENIRYGRLDATDEEVIAAAKAAHIHNFIMQQPGGYQMVLDEETSNVSQGQKQLLTIARAILADNKILILDEATSSVDTRTEVQIQKAMDNLMKGRTSFVIAHRLSTIKDADLILVMKDGDIIEQGSHEELLAAKGFYADLYNSQFDKTQSA